MTSPDAPIEIVIAGGGVAAIEAVLALRASGRPDLSLTLVSASPSFHLPPLSALKPFARGHSGDVSLAEFMHAQDGRFIEHRVASVEPARRALVLEDGAELPYDELIVAVGGQPVKGTDRGTGFDPDAYNTVTGIASDLELGWAGSVAVVLPDGPSWPLPGYEIALQLAQQLGGAEAARGHVHLFIPTEEPLEAFGAVVSQRVREALAQAGVTLHAGTAARVVRTGLVERSGGLPPVPVDRVLAMPRIVGPAIPGLPQDEDGFIVVDDLARVAGTAHVHAAGDGTTQPLKFGAIACQQADVAVADLLAVRGLAPAPAPLAPLLDARLVAGDQEVALHHDPSGANRPPIAWPAGGKIAGRYLTPWVEAQALSHIAHRGA